ncbi:MAG: helix-turn-helix domain-containing protein [Candidatus Gastranaerophilaceae bacterium]|nr:helix-turn-helix domain-containing protein [Candidatus Gastranaerophilaceae bacterium]
MTDTTKEQAILEYLKQGHELTSLEAMTKFNVSYLPHYICDYRKQGYNIQSIQEQNPRTKATYHRYKLVDNEIQDISDTLKRAKAFKNNGKDTEARAEAQRVIAVLQETYC